MRSTTPSSEVLSMVSAASFALTSDKGAEVNGED